MERISTDGGKFSVGLCFEEQAQNGSIMWFDRTFMFYFESLFNLFDMVAILLLSFLS